MSPKKSNTTSPAKKPKATSPPKNIDTTPPSARAAITANTTAPKYTHASAKWKNGDFEVITADGVRFLVPSHFLFFGSFETKSDAPIKYSVTLLDPEYETSVVLDEFLYLVAQLPLEDLGRSSQTLELADFKRIRGLLKFMAKWECPQSLHRVVQHNLKQMVGESENRAILLFVIGAAVDNLDLCRSAVAHWARLGESDPAYWPLWVWQHCPPLYLAALNRVCVRKGRDDNRDRSSYLPEKLLVTCVEELRKESPK